MKPLYTILLILSFSVSGFTQPLKGKHFVLDNNLSGEDRQYTARDYIKLKPGFEYTPETGKSFVGEIDPTLVVATDYNEPPTAWSNDLPAGSLPGSVNVSNTGAATYSIPIALPPGTAGMMPQLAISYNSQSGDGMLGRGWTISGFSAISRVPATLFHDGLVDGVDFDGNDRFALDGQRLVNTSGEYGADGTVYHTEIESFSKITSHGTAGRGPAMFEVLTKSGMRLYYGYTGDSRIEAQGKSDVLVWLLNKAQDPFGNFYTIEYEESNSEFYPVKIEYTGNADITPYNSIELYYTEKTDKSTAYIAGSRVNSTVLLSDIKIKHENRLIRKYSFKYDFNDFSRLTEILYYEDKDKQLNSTKIEWGDETSIYFEEDTHNNIYADGGNRDIFPGDYDGDGRTDLFIVQYAGVEEKMATEFKYFRATENNGFDELFVYEDLSYEDYSLTVGDFNGNGKHDISFSYKDNDDYKIKYGFIISDQLVIEDCDLLNTSVKVRLYTADFNGDSKGDIIMERVYTNVTSYYAHCYGDDVYYSLTDALGDKIMIADFLGSGKDQILFYGGVNGFELFEFDAHKKEFTGIKTTLGFYQKENDDYLTTDVNGDGKSDLISYSEDRIRVGFSDGMGSFPFANQYYRDVNDNFCYYLAGDYNGDGRSELIEYIHDYGDAGGHEDDIITIKIYKLNPYATIQFVVTSEYLNLASSYSISGYSSDDPIYRAHVSSSADFNGDGKTDFLLQPNRPFLKLKTLFVNPEETIGKVKSITNGLNSTIHIEYAPLTTTDENIYDPSGQNTNYFYPMGVIRAPLYVVNSTSTPNGVGGTETLNYKYTNAIVHKKGLGFLGFDRIEKSNSQFRTISNFSFFPSWLDYPALAPIPVSIQKRTINGTLLSVQNNTIKGRRLNNNKTLFWYPDEHYEQDLLSDIQINKSYVYDNYGNATQTITDYNGEGTHTVNFTYGTHGSWCPNKPETKTISMQRPDMPTYTRQSQFIYYPNGQLKKAVSDPNLANTITTEYFYNDCGLPTGSQTTAPGEETRNTSQTYDNKFRFVTSQTDVLGFTSFATYDSETGNTLSETDINGHTTTYRYDDFGRLSQTRFPDGTSAYQNIDWYKERDIANAHTVSISGADGQSPVTTYFDRLGRKIRTESLSFFDNQTVISETEYNAKGQVRESTEAHFEGQTGNSTLYYYDNYGRPTATVSDAGSLQYYYAVDDNPRKNKIIYPDGSFKISILNNFGEAQSIEDNGGTIN